MKLKKNVALVMVAAAMLAGGYAQADNPPPNSQGGTAEQINNPTGARAATAIRKNLSKDGQRGGIFSKKNKKGEEDDSRGYKKEWAQQGCTEEAWVELNNQYDKSINMSVDQSAVTDQKIMDVIQNPNQMNIKGFDMLGCNLNDSLKTIQSITNKVREIMQAIGSGNPFDRVKAELEKRGRELIQNIAKEVEKKFKAGACKLLNEIVSDADEFVDKNLDEQITKMKAKGDDLERKAQDTTNQDNVGNGNQSGNGSN